jgi:hypothetical protein
LFCVISLAACGDDVASVDLAHVADMAAAPADMAAAVVTTVGISMGAAKILVGDTPAFVATATYSDSTTKDVTATATWASSDTSIATVSAGNATGVAAGSTMITATFDGIASSPASLAVRTVSSLALTWPGAPTMPSTTVNGASIQFTATATLSDSDTLDVTSKSTWTTSAPTIVPLFTNGLAIPGMNNGTSDISATFAGQSAMVTMLVN